VNTRNQNIVVILQRDTTKYAVPHQRIHVALILVTIFRFGLEGLGIGKKKWWERKNKNHFREVQKASENIQHVTSRDTRREIRIKSV
jgi:hypothetical protein